MTGPDLPPAALRLGIDREALAHNWQALDAMSGSAPAGAAVKADGYGLGVDHVVPALSAAGAREFFVAHWSEVPALLRHVPADQISVLHGLRNAQEARFALATGVRPVLNSLEQVGHWIGAGGATCHLMVDSGINRLGLPMADLGDEAIARLEVDICMSHLASADEDSPKNAAQLAAFRSVSSSVRAKRYSLANSAGIALGTDYAFDLTRPGLSLYGGIARPELADRIKQVAWPQAAILQMRDLVAGDAVGYNALFTAAGPMRVATVAIGYADGFLRCRGPGSALHKDGLALPILGRVSMDMIVVDCTGCPEAREGDFLNVPFDLLRNAEASGLSQYELLTTLGKRFDTTN